MAKALALIPKSSPASAVPDDEAQARDLAASIERIARERDEAHAALAALPAAREAAHLIDDGGALDKLDLKEKHARRAIERAALVLPRLERSLSTLNEEITSAKLSKARDTLRRHYELIAVAFEALIDANSAAVKARDEALDGLGWGFANRIEPIAHPLANWGTYNAWRRFHDAHFDPPKPSAAAGVQVRFVASWGPFQAGEIAGFADEQARAIVAAGVGELVDGEAAQKALFAADPRKAIPPLPDESGNITVLVVRMTSFLIGAGRIGFVPGDLIQLPAAQAIAAVRGGVAEFMAAASPKAGTVASVEPAAPAPSYRLATRPPGPDKDGRAAIVMLKPLPDVGLRRDDLVSLPHGEAMELVRNLAAEFVEPDSLTEPARIVETVKG